MEACQKYYNLMEECKLAKGCDRHLLGLAMIASVSSFHSVFRVLKYVEYFYDRNKGRKRLRYLLILHLSSQVGEVISCFQQAIRGMAR